MSKTELRVVTKPRSPARVALATAISEHANAERDHRAAREAVDKARERAWAAQDRLAALQERPAEATGNPAIAFISAMQGGREASVAELNGPAKTREAEEAEIAAEIEVLQKTRAALDESVVERQGAVAYAKGNVKGAAAEVLCGETDVGALIREAEAAAADIVARRCALLQLQSLLPPSQEKKAIDSFLAHPWLIHQLNGGYVSHPAAQAITAARDALLRDADADVELPTS